MAELGSKTMAAKLRAGKIERVGMTSEASRDVIDDTPMIVTLDQIRPYELNPRVTRNPRYDEIKASIRERGLDAPPAITRRPGEQHFIIRNGGNTRLAILGELWSETKDERFYRISCLYRAWTDRGEIVALTGHLAENELHGGLSFIERALGIERARELYEQESGKELTQSELARRLSADGYPITQPHISRMQDAVRYLLPAIPTVLYGGLGRPQTDRLTALHKAGARIWDAQSADTRLGIEFQSLFQDVLVTFDGDVDGFSVQRVQDELVGQMADLLKADYDALTLEITDTESKHRASGSSSAEPHATGVQPTTPTSTRSASPKPAPARKQSTAPAEPELELEPSPPSLISPSSAGGARTECGEHDVQLQSQTATTLHPHQDRSGRDGQDPGASEGPKTPALPKVCSLANQHTADAAVWSIEPGFGTPEDLRVQIVQFAREIADEVGQADRIKATNAGIGFICAAPRKADVQSMPLLPRVVLASLRAVSDGCGSTAKRASDLDVISLAEVQEGLLHGHKDTTSTSVERLTDHSLLQFFRLIRLARRVRELETGLASHTSASIN